MHSKGAPSKKMVIGSSENGIQNKNSELSRLDLYKIKNSITKTYETHKNSTLDFSRSTILSNQSFNETPSRRADTNLSQITRNSNSFQSAKDTTPNLIPSLNITNKNITNPNTTNQSFTIPNIPSHPSPVVPARSTPLTTCHDKTKIILQVPSFKGIGNAKRPMMNQSELKNHKDQRRYDEKLRTSESKVLQHYVDFGHPWMVKFLNNLKDSLVFENADFCQKLRDQEKETARFEKKQDGERAKLKSLKTMILQETKENKDLKKRDARLKKVEQHKKRTLRKKCSLAQAKLEVLLNKNKSLQTKTKKTSVTKKTKTSVLKRTTTTKKTTTISKTNNLSDSTRKQIYAEKLAAEAEKKNEAKKKRVAEKKKTYFSSSEDEESDIVSDFEGLIKD